MNNHKRLIGSIAGLLVALMTIGIGLASTGIPLTPRLAAAVINPLHSTLASPAQLSSCVTQAIQYTQVAYPSDKPISVKMAQQVTDTQWAQLAPSLSGHKFGVLMNVLILHGNFQHPLNKQHLPYILYVLMPYPDCSATLMTFNVKDFGLKQ